MCVFVCVVVCVCVGGAGRRRLRPERVVGGHARTPPTSAIVDWMGGACIEWVVRIGTPGGKRAVPFVKHSIPRDVGPRPSSCAAPLDKVPCRWR